VRKQESKQHQQHATAIGVFDHTGQPWNETGIQVRRETNNAKIGRNRFGQDFEEHQHRRNIEGEIDADTDACAARQNHRQIGAIAGREYDRQCAKYVEGQLHYAHE